MFYLIFSVTMAWAESNTPPSPVVDLLAGRAPTSKLHCHRPSSRQPASVATHVLEFPDPRNQQWLRFEMQLNPGQSSTGVLHHYQWQPESQRFSELMSYKTFSEKKFSVDAFGRGHRYELVLSAKGKNKQNPFTWVERLAAWVERECAGQKNEAKLPTEPTAR